MAQGAARPLIVKKVVKGGDGGHHGGAWKVAYADFVTAMMAFFLLMWLLNATTEKQRKGIADYFDPSIPLARISAGGNNLLSGDTVTVPEHKAGSVDEELAPRRRAGEPAGEPGAADGVADGPAETGPQAAFNAARRAEQARLEAVAREVEDAIAGAGDALGRHFLVHMTPEGLVIEIVDTGEGPLFARGSAVPSDRLGRLIEVIVPVIAVTANPVAVIGHTDATPFGSGRYGNWELSTDRANAARRLMVDAGLAESRLANVSGRAATDPLSVDPLAPENRRIAITLQRLVPR